MRDEFERKIMAEFVSLLNEWSETGEYEAVREVIKRMKRVGIIETVIVDDNGKIIDYTRRQL